MSDCECRKRQWTPQEHQEAIEKLCMQDGLLTRNTMREWHRIFNHKPHCPHHSSEGGRRKVQLKLL
jgi:hypothetical protein